MEIRSMNEVITFDSSFKTAINLYLSLNKTDKVLNYIPTKSSVQILNDYMEAVLGKKTHATLLVGPYGKGKSHLLLVLLAIISLERCADNDKIINVLKDKLSSVEEIGEVAAENLDKIWSSKRFLPVIINDSQGNLHQSFLSALNDALKREKLEDFAPDTYFSEAVKRIENWKEEYPETYKKFSKELKERALDINKHIIALNQYSKAALDIFCEIYPRVTSGSNFNPLAISDVQELYKSVGEKLVEDYDYAGIYIVFDEFSKFIEGIDNSNSGNTMKLLQSMIESAYNSSNVQMYITMVAHKSIKEYGKYLSADTINSFTAVEGRFVEKYFVTSSKNNYELIRNAIHCDEDKKKHIPGIKRILGEESLENYYQLPAFKTNFSMNDFDEIVLKGCYPLNPIAAYLLLNISEKVAQNERTLFTFISNDEQHSMARYVSEHTSDMGWEIGADLIYDYFCNVFKKDIANELVHNIWLGAEYAISKCKSVEEIKLIKALALIQIVNKPEELSADEKYLSLAALLVDGNSTISELVDRQLIYKKSSIGAYVFKTRAGSELKAELKKKRALKGANGNYSKALQGITAKHFVIPRRYNTENMMTRYFRHEYMSVDTFFSISNATVLFDKADIMDGKVITLYGCGRISQKEIKAHYEKLRCKKLVLVVPYKSISVEKELTDYEILQEIKANQTFIHNNEILEREIPLLEDDIIKAVSDELEAIYEVPKASVMYWMKDSVCVEPAVKEENAVNEVCRELYFKTPIINNELVNRTNISTAQTRKARLNIIQAILNGEDNETFYSGTNQEATIYRSVFCQTGIKCGKTNGNIKEILDILNGYVDSCCDNKSELSSTIDLLVGEPYGMRLGVIPLLLAKVLAERKEDLVAYFSDMEIQIGPEVIVNMCEKPEEYSLFVSKEDLEKEAYIRELSALFAVEDSRALTENRIKNIVLCMQRWFRSLPQVTRNLTGLNEYGANTTLHFNMRAIKKIMQKVDINPYEILFVNIPNEFENDDLHEVFNLVKLCKEAFDEYHSWVVQRTINGIYEVYGGKRKLDLYHVLKEWYDSQSNLSKKGLHEGGVTNLMSCIERMDVYNDLDVAQKIAKSVTNVYIENWIDSAYEDFISELTTIKCDVEQIKEEKTEGKLLLTFTGSKGNKIEKYYDKVDEGTGIVLRNIIEDTLDEYDDLSVNDRVGILLEMIEKIIGQKR